MRHHRPCTAGCAMEWHDPGAVASKIHCLHACAVIKKCFAVDVVLSLHLISATDAVKRDYGESHDMWLSGRTCHFVAEQGGRSAMSSRVIVKMQANQLQVIHFKPLSCFSNHKIGIYCILFSKTYMYRWDDTKQTWYYKVFIAFCTTKLSHDLTAYKSVSRQRNWKHIIRKCRVNVVLKCLVSSRKTKFKGAKVVFF